MRFWSVFYLLFFGFGCLLDIQEPAGSNQASPTAADVSVGEDMTRTDAQLADIHVASAVDDGVGQPRSDAEMGIQSMSDVDVDADADADAARFVETPFFDEAWQHRVRIRITPPAIAESAQNVPVYLRIRLDQLANADAVQPDGDDLRFVDAAGTVIPYSYVGCGLTDNTIGIVVRLPSIEPDDMNQFFWMYYGNDAATASDLAAWVDSDLAMFHMCEIVYTYFLVDRTGSNSFGGVGMLTQVQDSTWGRAIMFPNGGEGLRIRNSSNQEFSSGDFTVSFSTRLLGVNEGGLLFGSSLESDIQYRLLYMGNDQCRFEGVGTDDPNLYPVMIPCPDMDNQHHFTLISSPSSTSLIVDGVVHNAVLPQLSVGGPPFAPTEQKISFLAETVGEVDEVQFSRVRHSTSWAVLRQASLMETLLSVDY